MKTRVFHLTKTFPDKVNFIDSNDVLVGYCMTQCCCESASWTISESKDGINPIHEGHNSDEAPQEFDIENYWFDPEFCEVKDDDSDNGNVAIFKLVTWKGRNLYLRLENTHNGYYSHGFTFRGTNSIEGSL